MTRSEAIDEMVSGYLDGIDPNSPEPSDNRSHSYRHGFANGRDDLNGNPRSTAVEIRLMGDDAIAMDCGW